MTSTKYKRFMFVWMLKELVLGEKRASHVIFVDYSMLKIPG